MTGVSFDAVKGVYTYNLNANGATFGTDNTPAITVDGLTHTSLKSEVDYSALFGQKVTVVYKDDAKAGYPVYGIYADATVVAKGTIGDILGVGAAYAKTGTDTQILIAGTKYGVDKTIADVDLFNYNNTVGTKNADGSTVAATDLADTFTNLPKYTKFAAIDNNDDGKINMIVVYPVSVAKVTYVGTSSITVGGNSYAYDKDNSCYTNGGVKYDFPTVKKGDFVAITTDVVTNTNAHAEVLKTVEGKATALNATLSQVQIDGTWYKYLTAAPTLNSIYKFQEVNGYLVDAETITAASTDILYVIASEAGNTMRKAQADVMFSDGTRAVIDINKKDGVVSTSALSLNVLYTYTKNSDGTYDVKVVDASNKAGHTGLRRQRRQQLHRRHQHHQRHPGQHPDC